MWYCVNIGGLRVCCMANWGCLGGVWIVFVGLLLVGSAFWCDCDYLGFWFLLGYWFVFALVLDFGGWVC